MDYTKNLVSVVIPTYNRAAVIEPSIRSVMSQTYDDIEIIVSNDKSTDDTSTLIKAMAKEDDRIKYIVNQGEKGASGARNAGIMAASGEFIAFQDSDTTYVSDKIGKQVSALRENPDRGFCYSRFRQWNGAGRSEVFPPENMDDVSLSGDIFSQLMYSNLIGCPTLIIRHDLLDEVGGFDTNLKALEDYDLAIRLGKVSKASFIGDILLDADYSEGSVNQNPANYLSA